MNTAAWIVIILLILIIIVLPIIPRENCISVLGQNIACTTKHISIADLILGK